MKGSLLFYLMKLTMDNFRSRSFIYQSFWKPWCIFLRIKIGQCTKVETALGQSKSGKKKKKWTIKVRQRKLDTFTLPVELHTQKHGEKERERRTVPQWGTRRWQLRGRRERTRWWSVCFSSVTLLWWRRQYTRSYYRESDVRASTSTQGRICLLLDVQVLATIFKKNYFSCQLNDLPFIQFKNYKPISL